MPKDMIMILLLYFVCLSSCVEGKIIKNLYLTSTNSAGILLDTFHTLYNIEESFPSAQRGLTFKRPMIENVTKFQEITICFRVKIDYFTIIGDYIFLVDMIDGGRTERVLDFRIRDPLTNTNLFRFATFKEQKFEMRKIGNRDWQWPPLTNPVNVLDWNHFCISYSAEKSVYNRIIVKESS